MSTGEGSGEGRVSGAGEVRAGVAGRDVCHGPMGGDRVLERSDPGRDGRTVPVFNYFAIRTTRIIMESIGSYVGRSRVSQ